MCSTNLVVCGHPPKKKRVSDDFAAPRNFSHEQNLIDWHDNRYVLGFQAQEAT